MTRADRVLMLSAGLALAAALWVACAGAPPAVPKAVRSVAPGSVLVTVEFEPSLLAPARLQVVHESGEHLDVATQCTGVTLLLPPGPALLRLVDGERSLEHLLQVQPGMLVVALDVSGLVRSP